MLQPPVPHNRAVVVWRKHIVQARKIPKRKTICEVLRRLYKHAVENNDEYSQNLLTEAYDMGKRMDMKLHAYKHQNRDIAEQLAKADRLYGDIHGHVLEEDL
jgi:hypothetical protein